MADEFYTISFDQEPATPIKQRTPEEQKIYEVVKNRILLMKQDTEAANGQRVLNRDFYNGDQWAPQDWRTTTMVTDNKCQPIVDKYVSFFMGEPPRDIIPLNNDLQDLISSQSAKIDDEEMNSEALDKATLNAEVCKKILDMVKNGDNNWTLVTQEAAQYSFLYGSAFLKVLYDPENKSIYLDAINPGRTVVGWESDNYNTLEWFAVVSRRSIQDIYYKYGVKVDSEGEFITFDGDVTSNEMANVIDYWDDDMNVIIIGDHLIKAEKHNYGFVPLVHLPCLTKPGEPFGFSPIEPVIPLQRVRNELWSDLYDMVHYVPNNTIVAEGCNLDAKEIPTGSLPKILPIKAGGKLYPLELAKPGFEINRLLSDNLGSIDDVSGMPRIAYGQVDATLATGIGLTTAFQPAIQRMKMVANNWTPGLQKINEYILRIAEKHVKGAKEFIGGKYYTKIAWGKFSPRDFSIQLTNVINAKNSKLYSTRRSMEELGVENPREEMVEIAMEENNPWLNPQLALQKEQAKQQALQVIQQGKQQQQQSNTPQPPTLTPDQNQFSGAQPMAMPNAGRGAPKRNAPQQPNVTPGL